jgi:hypothetical protein
MRCPMDGDDDTYPRASGAVETCAASISMSVARTSVEDDPMALSVDRPISC